MPMTSRQPNRRQVLIGSGVALTAGVLAGPPRAFAAPAIPDVDVHVLVIDGMRPDELTADLTPTLDRLAAEGTAYSDASAIMVAETLPNHAAMMTGVLPSRSGVPSNAIFDPEAGGTRDLDRPTDLKASTVLDRVRDELGLVTASVLSKRYLHGLFGDRASVVWDPAPLMPGTEHAPDIYTMRALIDTLDGQSPRLTFTNLGDVDRVGHLDLSGVSLRIARTEALRNTDRQVEKLVEHLRGTGAWSRSVLIVLADHSMDWSEPSKLIGLTRPLNADPLLEGKVEICQNGGADLIYWTGGPAARDTAVDRIRQIVAGVEGVESTALPAELDLGSRAGDVIAFCLPGWRFSDPTPLSNPIPGNHGHRSTQPIPFFVTGGHPQVQKRKTVSEKVHTIDVAPTVAALFGLPAPAGGWDGKARLQAFSLQ
ncbi:alkaline phosphatase family protein [Rhodococcus sp. NPDC058521]|uniref:alkaline phosphatase family protein n=1 Tax=Rhodococcus sp. NPDC058521 TaxID=3346536 RepID=UPI0036500639